MKTVLLAALLVVAAGAATRGQAAPVLGLYADEEALRCVAGVTPYLNVPVYVVALLSDGVTGLTACEFRIEHLPSPAMATISTRWNSPLVIGELGNGIALAFSPPLTGESAVIGAIDFFPLQDFGPDWVMEVMPSNDSGSLVIVDLDYVLVPCEADHGFTFNCSGECQCLLGNGNAAATWGQIKALY
jgi:hypothetical protein